VAPRGAAADSAFRYQGILTAGSQPASGLYDLAFSLHPAPDGIEQLGSPLTNSAIALQDGLLTTDLDFGITPFTGADLWLEIQVRPTAGDDPFVTLNPRQRLAPTPYALHAFAAQYSAQADVALTVPPDSVTALQIAPESITGDRLANAQVVRSLNGLRDELLLHAGDNLSLSTTGNSLTFTGSYDWSLTGNADTLPGKNFVGTSDPQPLEFKVNNNRALRLEPTSFATVVNVIGGSSGNFVRPGTTGATIAGGGAVYPAGSGDFTNAVHAEFGTIGGGYANWIGTNAPAATIAGGHLNSIERDAAEATIGGGLRNKIAAGAFRANIAGGYLHTIEAQAIAAFIGGGTSNMVSSYYSTVGGGSRNSIASNSPTPPSLAVAITSSRPTPAPALSAAAAKTRSSVTHGARPLPAESSTRSGSTPPTAPSAVDCPTALPQMQTAPPSPAEAQTSSVPHSAWPPATAPTHSIPAVLSGPIVPKPTS
jgi:hypothetical protein